MNKMDDITKELIKQAYEDAMLLYGAEHLGKELKAAGIDSNDPEVVSYLKELDKLYGIF